MTPAIPTTSQCSGTGFAPVSMPAGPTCPSCLLVIPGVVELRGRLPYHSLRTALDHAGCRVFGPCGRPDCPERTPPPWLLAEVTLGSPAGARP